MKLLWNWVNEPEVRASSFQSDPISWKDHVRWFGRKMADSNCHMYIALDNNGTPIGQVRCEIQNDDIAVVSISIARGHRGRGYAAQVLQLGCDTLRGTRRVKQFVGYIKPENTPSIRAFQRAGFVPSGQELVKGQKAVKYSLNGEEVRPANLQR